VIRKKNLTASCKLLCLCFLLTGCAVRSVYIPVMQNTPQFDDRKALQATAYIGTNHIELQGAHNAGRHFAVCGNVSYGSGISIYDGAVGTFGYNGKKNWRYEVFAGYGYNTNIAYQVANYNNLLNKPVTNYEVRSFYDKFYIQPAAGYHGDIKMYKMDYSFILGARISTIYFKTFSYREIDNEASNKSGQTVYIQNINYYNKLLYLLEPCLTNKFGSRGFYGILQCQFIIPYSEQIDLRNTTFSQAFILSLGLQYNLVFKQRKNVPKD
jgi:hypothetical protein